MNNQKTLSIYLLSNGTGAFNSASWCLRETTPFLSLESAQEAMKAQIEGLQKYRAVQIQHGAYANVQYFDVITQGADKLWRAKEHYLIQTFEVNIEESDTHE